MTLAESQASFWAMATRAEAAPAASATKLLVGTDGLSAEERIGIYADMFIWRQVDALREDFPKVASALGDDAFYGAAEAYIRAHPSAHPSLAKLGRHFADFVSRAESRADLGDLAALEWARAEVFEAPDAHVASADVLTSARPDKVAELKLAPIPALRLLTLEHDVLGVWTALEDASPAPTPVRQAVEVVVWRKGFEVFHVGVEADEAEALRRAMAGRTLGEICDAMSKREDPAAAAFVAIGSWLAEGWIRDSTEEGAR